MSRLSDALRRAGHDVDEGIAAATDDASFVAGENVREDRDSEHATEYAPGAGNDSLAQESQTQPTLSAGPLVPSVRQIPIELTRRGANEDVEILDVMRVLLRRWKLVGAVVVISLGIAAAYNYRAARVFEARARIMIEPESPQVVPFRPVEEDTSRDDYYVTQIEVLRSRALAKLALEKLGLLSASSAAQSSQIAELTGALTVTPVVSPRGDTRVVGLSYQSKNPVLAARIVNGIARTYVDQNFDNRRQGAREASKWLNDRLAELRKDVTASAGALQQYREQRNAVSLDDKQNIVVQKLAQLNEAVTAARTVRVQKEVLYQQLVAIRKGGAPLDTFPPILSNDFIQRLKVELAGLQRERVELAEKLGDLHPDMLKLDAAIATAEHRLNAEMGKVVEGIRNDFKAAEDQERGLATALEDQKREVLDLNQKAIAYGALQRDATSTQQIFDGVLQRLKETELSGELQTNNVRILDAAELPRFPIWPRTQLNLIVALLGGTLVGVGFAICLEYLNPRISKPEDVTGALGLPLLGIAPDVPALKNGPVHIEKMPRALQEALRDIRTRILLSPTAGAARTLAVTSTIPGEGKTLVASSLAASLAMAGRRVLLVDADMRRPQVHNVFKTPRSPGLSDVMAGEIKPSEALRESTVKRLFVLPTGSPMVGDSELLDSERLSSLIQGFSQVFDAVVLDCPPAMALADASIIANAAASVLFVVGAGHTSQEAARAAIERLTSVQARVVGVVLNKAKRDVQAAYHYSYYELT